MEISTHIHEFQLMDKVLSRTGIYPIEFYRTQNMQQTLWLFSDDDEGHALFAYLLCMGKELPHYEFVKPIEFTVDVPRGVYSIMLAFYPHASIRAFFPYKTTRQVLTTL